MATKFESVGALNILVHEVASDLSPDDLRSIALDLRNRKSPSVVALLSKQGERVALVVAVTPDALALGVKAGELVKLGSGILGGGGGGKDDFAQGGGTDTTKIHDAISELKAAIGTR